MARRIATALLVLAALASASLADVGDLAAGQGVWRFTRGTTIISRQALIDASWSDRTRLALRARLSRNTLHTVHLVAYLVSGEGWWYQGSHTVELETTRAKAVSLDLSAESADWVPRGHLRPWDGYVTRQVRAVGLKAFCDGEFEGSVIIEGVALRTDGAPARQRLRLLDFQAPRTVRVGERCEIRFRLPRVFSNPFDPDEVNIQGLFIPPGGETDYRLVPGFFYQRYFRRWEAGAERLAPAGPAEWRIRFWPDSPGTHNCQILVRTPDGEARVPWTFQVEPGPEAAPGGNRGGSAAVDPAAALKIAPPDFVVARDYDGREAIYIHRPGGWRADGRTPPAGTIHAWRVPLEWTERWGSYGGLGRFNLPVASQFDDTLDAAQAKGIALPLALTCNEPFGERAKYNWKDHPLSKSNGGPLEAPSLFYTSPIAWDRFRNRCRYVLARWGGHPAVTSWELWCTLPANGAALWHEKAGEYLATWRLGPKDVRSHHPQTVPPASLAQVNTFRQAEMDARSRDRWMAHSVIKHTAKTVRTSSRRASDGPESLEVVASYPGEAAILRTVERDWHAYDRLAFDVFVPTGAPNDMRVMVYLRDGDLWWYETLLPTYLRPGDWTKLLVDLSGEITQWQPRGHEKVFDRYALQRVRVLGIRVFGHRAYQGSLYIDNIQLWRHPAPRRRKRVKVTFVRPNAVTIPRFGKFELTFRLSKTYLNPFDPGVANILGHFTSPSGKKTVVPAFFFQDYKRHLVDGREFLTPKGRPCWKVRFAPTERGAYTYSVTANGQRLAAIEDQHFDSIPSKRTGFVRRSKADPRYFELTTGQFFYPIGMNLRSPSDNRRPYPPNYTLPEGRGTYIYDEYYKKLAENQMNWARVWQCPWWCGLEWTRRWPGFQGLGRYNLESAWRFDYVLDQAARRGIYVQVCLTNHGQITIERNIDRQWDSNPLNADLGEGGPLQRAAEFYTNGLAKKLFRQRMRYTVARWGYSPHLMAWALFSEMEFTEAYWRDANGRKDNEGWARCPVMAEWVGEMAAHVKRIDPFHHLVTTHFSHPWRGRDIWERPELDLVQSNAYSAFSQLGGDWRTGAVAGAIPRYYERYMGRYGRPVLIAEYGGHWMRNSAEKLDAELHAGIWSSLTTHLAGCTGYWWWLHVHFTDKHNHYRAAARYMAGEDRRGQKLLHAEPRVFSPAGSLRARALKNDRVAYVWVYHPSVVRSLEGIPPVDGARLDLPDMTPGRYRIEFWNTYTGEVSGRLDMAFGDTTLHIALPTFRNDIALKIKLAKRRGR